jgi:hypothetical protein
LLVHSCWCIVLFVLGLNSNLFEFKRNGLNGLSVEKEKGKEEGKEAAQNPLARGPTPSQPELHPLSLSPLSRTASPAHVHPSPFLSLPIGAHRSASSPFPSAMAVQPAAGISAPPAPGPACRGFRRPISGTPDPCALISPPVLRRLQP